MAGMPPQMPVEAAGLARCFLAVWERHGARSGASTARNSLIVAFSIPRWCIAGVIIQKDLIGFNFGRILHEMILRALLVEKDKV